MQENVLLRTRIKYEDTHTIRDMTSAYHENKNI